MLHNTFTKWLWDNRRSVIGWTIAIAGVGVFYGGMWPAFNDPEILKTFESYPESLMEALNYTNIVTPTGYINATVYGLVVANLTVVYAVMTGTRIIAGDEDAGRLDLMLALPMSRTSFALQRFAAVLVSMAVIFLGLLVMMAVLAGPAELEGISIADLAAMNVHVLFFGGFFAALAFSIGAGTGRKTLAIGVGVGVAVVGFAANGVLTQIEGLAWIEHWSPYNWLNGGLPLENGLQIDDLLIMGGLVVVLVAIGAFGFNRRDVDV
jgi:ABC-2 type transport system permease protein